MYALSFLMAQLAFATPAALVENPQPNVVTITANDYEFVSPATVPAGAVTFRLVNQGKELHHAQLVGLPEGRTLEDFMGALQRMEMPTWATWLGGPSPAGPGMEANATVVLRPGRYVWICMIPSPEDKQPHLAKGMVREMVVEEGARGELPTADVLVRLSDYDFELSKPLRAGKQVIRIRNYASQLHELALVKLLPGKTAEDFAHWAETAEGPPPAIPIGGVAALDSNSANSIEVDLEPGRYGIICFLPDVKDGKPHFMHGMAKEIVVE